MGARIRTQSQIVHAYRHKFWMAKLFFDSFSQFHFIVLIKASHVLSHGDNLIQQSYKLTHAHTQHNATQRQRKIFTHSK